MDIQNKSISELKLLGERIYSSPNLQLIYVSKTLEKKRDMIYQSGLLMPIHISFIEKKVFQEKKCLIKICLIGLMEQGRYAI